LEVLPCHAKVLQLIAMNSQRLVYLDNNATTRVAPEVVDAMIPFLTENWGNPSSAYSFGHQLGASLSAARAQVAALINAEPREIIFTSCGTEGNNAALHSALFTQPSKHHVVTTAVEHSATNKFCSYLQKRGNEVTFVPVTPEGELRLDELEKALRPDTAIVSVMWANNETGMLFPVQQVANLCRKRGILFHTDAVQVPGKLKIDVKELEPDFLSLSGHKLHAPKGIGLLYVRRGVKYQPFVIGGGQERGRRGGTENVAGIVAFGRAAELAAAAIDDENNRIRNMRDRLEDGLLNTIPNTLRNGAKEPRLPNTTNLAFAGVEAEGVLLLLDQAGICASSGSACTTGSLEPSHVLTAMGYTPSRCRGSLRLSLGKYNKEEDVDRVLSELPAIILKLRKFAPV
jgi:cysteine desulfurase